MWHLVLWFVGMVVFGQGLMILEVFSSNNVSVIPPGGFEMVKFSLCLAQLCLLLFLSLSATCSHALLPVCVSSLHTPLHTCPPGCALAAMCTLTTCTPLPGSLAFPLPACLLSLPYILLSFPSVSLCLLLCLGLALSSASCVCIPLYLACSDSVFLSLFLSLPPVPSCSLYLQHVSICSCRFRRSTQNLYVYMFFAVLRCFEVI